MNVINNIFKAYDVRGKVGSELTPEVAGAIGKAFADWLPTDGVVAVGRDMRPDSAELADALIDGLRTQGRTVWDIGEVTSDMIYFAIGKFNLAGGAVVTASHNPGAYNGIKIYRDQVTPVGLDSGLDKIRDAALSGTFKPAAATPGTIEQHDITNDWIDHALSFVQPDSWPKYRIAIDAGNGMAGAILPGVLKRLPLEVEEMYFDLDGSFPNHEANPQKPENLRDLVKVVTDKGYDFGIAFDGDGDRAALVDDKGRPVLGTDMLTLVARHYLTENPGAEVVHEVRTSRATQEFIREWGGTPVRTKAGRINIGRVLREHHAPFGGETTGHLFFAKNFDADSGLIAALMAIQALSEAGGKKLSELVDEYRRYPMLTETNFEVTDTAAVFERLRGTYKDQQQDELDGLTVQFDDGAWFNLRASNTEPVVRLNAEAPTQEALDKLVATVTKLITNE
ncbi:MAG TPA: phosphomannomutase/phosphoglucomutase [Candidatus Saccharimonadales bacterium]|nr:phosphomannomutase/phosphoglucomutase [Candidatus Saccharimonadales bacterium]